MPNNNPSRYDDANPSAPRHAWRLFDLFRNATSPMLTRTAIVVAVAWLPLAIFTALQGHAAFLSFLTDYATQSRFLIIIPVLILGERPLHARNVLVAHHFEIFLVAENEQSIFQSQWRSFESLKESKVVRAVLLLVCYALAIWLSQFLDVHGSEFVLWWKGSSGFRFLSFAGAWAIFVSYPILAYVTLLWLWRQLVWARFLRLTSLLNLRLIAAHPDHVGGMGFLEAALLGQLPFSFCLGVGLSGAIANRVFHEGQKVLDYRFLAPFLIAAALLVAVAPYFFFTPTLMQMRRRGMLKYGALARAVGEKFEQKWLDRAESLPDDVLTTTDFTSTGNLFNIAHNIEEIDVVPVARINVYFYVIAALIPCLPVVLAAIPFNVLLKAAMKLLV